MLVVHRHKRLSATGDEELHFLQESHTGTCVRLITLIKVFGCLLFICFQSPAFAIWYCSCELCYNAGLRMKCWDQENILSWNPQSRRRSVTWRIRFIQLSNILIKLRHQNGNVWQNSEFKNQFPWKFSHRTQSLHEFKFCDKTMISLFFLCFL